MLSIKYSDWGKCKRMSVHSIFVLYFWFSFVYFWNLLINQMNFSEADSAYSTHVFQDLAQLLLDPEPFRGQVTFYHAEDQHSLGFICLFPLLSWPAENTVYSVFWFSFCRIMVPSVFHLRTSYNSSCLAPPSDILSCDALLRGCFLPWQVWFDCSPPKQRTSFSWQDLAYLFFT